MGIKSIVGMGLILVSGAASAACGSVKIADMNWNSATLIANVDRFILEHAFDCDAELVPGDTMPTGTSMVEKGEPDIAPELWTNSMKDALEAGVKEGRLVKAGKSLSDGGEEGFWVPQYLVDQYPEMATIDGIRKHAELFEHPEDPDKSAFYGCPAGWNCQITSANLFRALKLKDDGFELVDPGSGAGLSGAIARAYERRKPWFGYYWAPTGVLGKYKMVKVDFGSGVKEKHYVDCISKAECQNPQVTMYPPSPVYTVTTSEFAEKSPAALKYLSQRSFTNEQMNRILAWMEDNQADGETAMYYFLETYPDIWKSWLSDAAAGKVSDAL